MNIEEEKQKWLQSEKFKELKESLMTMLSYLDKEDKERFLLFFDNCDFYYAPASTKYHNNCFGGLMEHSINVFNQLQSIGVETRKAVRVALIHDFCKIDFYYPIIVLGEYRDMTQEEYEKNKLENPKSKATKIRDEKIGFEIRNDMMLGHGETSIIKAITNNIFMDLEEMQIVRWHMGFNDKYYNYYSYQNKLLAKNPNVVKMQFADQMSSLEEDIE